MIILLLERAHTFLLQEETHKEFHQDAVLTIIIHQEEVHREIHQDAVLTIIKLNSLETVSEPNLPLIINSIQEEVLTTN